LTVHQQQVRDPFYIMLETIKSMLHEIKVRMEVLES